MKRIVIVHGWKGTPDGNWFPWMREQLTEEGCAVHIPQMPRPEEPQQTEWVDAIRNAAGSPDDRLFLIGHSLGCIAVLRYLESLPDDAAIGGALLVAGFAEPLGRGYETHAPFFKSQVQWETIKRHCPRFIVIQSDNDPHVPQSLTESLTKNLSARLITIPGGKHFRLSYGFDTFPEALKALRTLTIR